MKLHRDLNITQKTAWHLAHRIRQGLMENPPDTDFFLFDGPVEVDETYIGGSESNMHYSKRSKGHMVQKQLKDGLVPHLNAENEENGWWIAITGRLPIYWVEA